MFIFISCYLNWQLKYSKFPVISCLHSLHIQSIFLWELHTLVTPTAFLIFLIFFLLKRNREKTFTNHIFSKLLGKNAHYISLINLEYLKCSKKFPSCIFILYGEHGHIAKSSHNAGLRHKKGFVFFYIVVQLNDDLYFEDNAPK